jgi:hypothetical protein
MYRDPLTYEAYTSTVPTGTYLNKVKHQYGSYVSTYIGTMMYSMVNTGTGRKFDTVIFYNPEEYLMRGIQVPYFTTVWSVLIPIQNARCGTYE